MKWVYPWVLWACACSSPAPVADVPRFTEGTAPSYVQSIAGAPCRTAPGECQPDHFTGALAVGDVDADGWLDVVVTRLSAHDLLFLGVPGGGFVDASVAWGLDVVDAHSNGAALFDADRDGDLDLYVVGLGPADAEAPHDRYHFFRNEGDHFTEDAEARGLSFASRFGHSGMSVAVGDYDRDGWPDLHLTEWRAQENAAGHPHERLLRNLGAEAPGHFEDVTLAAGVFLASTFCREDGNACLPRSFSSAFTDLDDDGWPDLVVASDFGSSRLFWNQADGTFVDGTDAAGVGTDENGMGSTVGDFDGDGRLDWFVSSIDDRDGCDPDLCGWGVSGNRLYRNLGDRRFEDATDAIGVRRGGWGWGAAFFDADLDGDLDLTMTNGFDEPGVDGFRDDGMRFWWNEGAAWTEQSAASGLSDDGLGRGLCVEDMDNDGDLDVLVVHHGAGLRLFENAARSATEPRADALHFVRIAPLYADGAIALGAKVTAFRSDSTAMLVREVGQRAHFLCTTPASAHFGLGTRTAPIDVEVRWPTGETTTHSDLAVDQLHRVWQDG